MSASVEQRGGGSATVLLYAVASFVSAGLLFLVQPMAAKLVLPLFGGSPSVWNTSMLFFQTVLLAGYAYAHVSTRWLGLGRQPIVHAVALLLPLLVLPIALPAGAQPPAGTAPALWLLYVLTLLVGAPFLLVSTSGPLLQRWFSGTDHPRAHDPYFLYAAGNAGSMLALLAYPLVVEPTLSLAAQVRVWSAGYVVLVLLALACAVALHRHRAAGQLADARAAGQIADAGVAEPAAHARVTGHAADRLPPLGLRRQLTWVLLAFLPSSLMLGVTTFVSTDIAVFPLLWVVPLALYLLTFVVAFGQRRVTIARHAAGWLPALVLATAIAMVGALSLPPALDVTLHLLMFTAVALVAHGKLAADRPEASRLTHFYLLVSVGGALGGLFNGLLAPVLFNHVVEYPLVIAVAVFVLIGAVRRDESQPPAPLYQRAVEGMVVMTSPWFLAAAVIQFGNVAAAVVIGVLLGARRVVATVAGWRPLAFALGTTLVLVATIPFTSKALLTERSFFGVARVEVEGDRHVLVHGTTIHGWQDRRPDHLLVPQSYYDRDGPVGAVFDAYGQRPVSDNVALIGLGTGGLAAYGRPGQTLTFYEIDQAIIDIAQDPRLFSYLSDTPAQVRVVLGDGRLSLAEAPDHSYGMIVIDAFSSDSIPVHLLTTEAFALYRTKLRPGGVVVFHLSNRHMNLEPVLAGIAARQGLVGMIRTDAYDPRLGNVRWAVLAETPAALAPLAQTRGWRPLGEDGRALVWTDDFSNVVRVIRWR